MWKRLERLARYSPPDIVTRRLLKEVLASLREWYYDGGGLFLSNNSRDVYFALMNRLTETGGDISLNEDRRLPEDKYEKITAPGSILRSSLMDDIGTRQRPRLKSED